MSNQRMLLLEPALECLLMGIRLHGDDVILEFVKPSGGNVDVRFSGNGFGTLTVDIEKNTDAGDTSHASPQ